MFNVYLLIVQAYYYVHYLLGLYFSFFGCVCICIFIARMTSDGNNQPKRLKTDLTNK